MSERPFISSPLRDEVVRRARSACEYCRLAQDLCPDTFEVDHIIPVSALGRTVLSNLCLACPRCNAAKRSQTHGTDPETGQQVPLFNPRRQPWRRHFQWSTDAGRIIGRTAVGRATCVALKMNSPRLVYIRLLFAKVGLHPPRR